MSIEMYFDTNEMVTITKNGGETREIKKQEISDFIVKGQSMVDIINRKVTKGDRPPEGMHIIEGAVILSNLNNVTSIQLTEDDRIVRFDPVGIRMKTSNRIWNFLISKFND